ncbi:hypothetical protein C1H46_042136 [Malus baccata]|uniref:AMP-activated protein kinase glycogen-binding domain-containing protein n=1 Tax=Malus baccata TaxID=106549 RepID=A0A540KEE1_MALBA|nr:hypothetical protein C1H46_042136 [Malus baccata]
MYVLCREAATTEDNTGVEGILNRLVKQRNLTLAFALGEKEGSASSADVTVAGLVRSSRPASLNPTKAILNDSRDRPNHSSSLSNNGVLRDSPRPDTWRTWSTHRAGVSYRDFEADEFSYDKMGLSKDGSRDEIFHEPYQRIKLDSDKKEIDHKQIRSRIKHLESELSSALRSLRSKADDAATQKGHESSSEDVQKLSDALEFQENEIMHAQDKLRSTRAKLAVLEGKMAMAIIEAQKIVKEKQKRINDACRALRLLRTACIVWPNSASEVLIAGSYDGWTTQIKFIVDGKWRIDPLRPIVRNHGYENNVMIIT